MQETENWSKNWKSSKKPTKQRKYRQNAPKHVKDKLISVNISQELRDELDTRNMPVRVGDRVKVMRGDKKGAEGIVSNIDRDNQRVYVNDVTVERQNGTETEIPLRPSNLQMQALNIDDELRLEKYDIDDIEEIGVEEEEMEEALEEDEEQEMMEQMQAGESGAHEQYEEDEDEEDQEAEETEEPEEDEETADVDYEDITSENVGDAKDQLRELENPDWEAALEAEKEGKNRKTLVEWLENKVE